MEFWISNMTKDTKLEHHRFDRAFHSAPKLNPALPSGFCDCCSISRERNPPETERLMVYEANSFTLAIFVHIYWRGPKVLQLELSHDKAHLGQENQLDETFSRMSQMLNPPDPDGTYVTRCKLHCKGKASTWLSTGRYKVTATLSHNTEYLLKVQLDEEQIN